MIIDCTMFHWEFDLLELRMKELWDTVDYFVVTESVCDHRGKERELILSNNLSQFDWASEKLIVNVSDKPKNAEISWDYEQYQRLHGVEYAINTLNPMPNDFFLISDIDEIFNPKPIQEISQAGGMYMIHMPMYYYYINLFVCDWFHARACSFHSLEDPNKLRTGKQNNLNYIYQGGWHFSFLGSPEQIKYKIDTFAHDEFDSISLNHIRQSIDNNTDVFGRNPEQKFLKVEIDNSFPQTILNNVQKYKNFIL
jgi:beta-1,4-mannosyl-glycoprotein beta-1,4-N-acetylglucosaminyltransferase